MAGIYLHIPFCKQACIYCNFHFSTSLKNKDALLVALKKEIEMQKNYLGTNEISTIYFGGGTPSLLSQNELMAIFETLNKHFNISTEAEITLEANPDDLTKQKLKELKDTPINRFSIGVQSFYDEDLWLLNRAHTAKNALHCVKATQDSGFENITIDLIYGIPTLTNANWKNNLAFANDMGIKHISAYCLTVEPNTALAQKIKAGEIKNVDEEKSANQFEIMLEAMEDNDFVQYEISNFCMEECYSKHNSNYWMKESYLGLGPSAHSFNGTSRQWNVSNNALYIQAIEKGNLSYEKEELTTNQQYNEYVLTSLRTMWGTDLAVVKNNYGQSFVTHCTKHAEKFIEIKMIRNENNKLFLTDKGKLFADKIASELFIV